MKNSNKKLNENVKSSSIPIKGILIPALVIPALIGLYHSSVNIVQFADGIIKNKIISTVEDFTLIREIAKSQREMSREIQGGISFCFSDDTDCKPKTVYGLTEKIKALEDYLGVELDTTYGNYKRK